MRAISFLMKLQSGRYVSADGLGRPKVLPFPNAFGLAINCVDNFKEKLRDECSHSHWQCEDGGVGLHTGPGLVGLGSGLASQGPGRGPCLLQGKVLGLLLLLALDGEGSLRGHAWPEPSWGRAGKGQGKGKLGVSSSHDGYGM